jgi:hypothetical protein
MRICKFGPLEDKPNYHAYAKGFAAQILNNELHFGFKEFFADTDKKHAGVCIGIFNHLFRHSDKSREL